MCFPREVQEATSGEFVSVPAITNIIRDTGGGQVDIQYEIKADFST